MQRPGRIRALRGMAVTGGMVILSLAGATAASASAAPMKGETAGSQQLSQPQRTATTTDGYRGTQGFNLCLLSRCSVGSSDRTQGGVGLVQGGNLCLLSLCEIRP
ncbi:hypothetical protein [Streptomyces sp. NPDC002790]|uniref:hypothetical protein n=1 Tax=Streptomyces sp. NPDC002790 TaxID=3154431 RepID=UPI003330F900